MFSLGGYFLGSKAENEALLQNLIQMAVAKHCETRRSYFPADPPYLAETIQQSLEYRATVERLTQHYRELLEQLTGSIPFWSHRWHSHMSWDYVLPSLLGYFAAMLYNPNNVAIEVSPVTTPLEIEVGEDLCRLLGYSVARGEDKKENQSDTIGKTIRSWGHITCGGSVANLEALWAARNLKYHPIAIARALRTDTELARARQLTVLLPTGKTARLLDLNPWHLLNLQMDEILALPSRLEQQYEVSRHVFNNAIQPYTLQNLGLLEFCRSFLPDFPPAILFAPSTCHYSWPKSAAILGIGKKGVRSIKVDRFARLDVDCLRQELANCLTQKHPVMMTVVVMGSTAESAVDPLKSVLTLRREFEQQGLTFSIHADAAWGGYFASMLRHPEGDNRSPGNPQERMKSATENGITLSPYVTQQFAALSETDSIAIDPHKAGYIHKPAGGLCYRNGALKDLVSLKPSVIFHDELAPTLGIYGVEGSKPGAASAAVWLAHRAIPLNVTGYGKIIGKCLFNSKRFYSALVTMARSSDPFIVVPLPRLPAAIALDNNSPINQSQKRDAILAQLDYIRTHIVPKTNAELFADPDAMKLLQELGADQTILAYAFNFKTPDGRLNSDLSLANQLNSRLFAKLSLKEYQSDRLIDVPLLVTTSQFNPNTYGREFVDEFARRLGVKSQKDIPIDFLISTTSNPWLTDTTEGNFIPIIIEVLRKTVIQLISEIVQ